MTDATDRLNAALEGRYRIDREIGEGGMATVYLAKDLKHNRNVALKVLKPELAAVVGAERLLAEIETTANLQHPHILPLFDSGEADSFLFYVMPLVEGESLRERIDRDKQLPVDEAVQITTAVAHALQHAHDRGVIHRDIKPANILMQDGQPVVADFGIALAVGAAGGTRLTETGLSVGTPFYMSPEQATGDQQVGPPSDTYALAAVLYEMLTGEPPYMGTTAQAVLGKIIQGAPVSVTQTRKSVPTNVGAAIRRALEKLPADRFTGAQDFARVLADRGFRHGEEALAGVAGGVRPWTQTTVILAAVAGLFWLSTAALGWSLLRPEPRPLARFEVVFGADRGLRASANGINFALSPDGSRIVYVGAVPGGGRQLWQRALNGLEADPIPGTEGANSPRVSPDGLSVAFRAQRDIKTVSLGGGPPLMVASGVASPAWGSDGMIYFRCARVICRVPATGGEPEAITTSPPSDGWHRRPDVLPDGRGLLLSAWRGSAAASRIAVVGPEGGDVREILTGAMARYAASGHVVYATAEGTLMAAPFDVKRLEVTGPPVSLLNGVAVAAAQAQSQFALSETGTLLYQTGGEVPNFELVWVNRGGAVERVDPAWTGNIRSPALSPDGTQLAVDILGTESRDIWVKQLDRGPSLRLTFEGTRNEYSTWMPDGESVTFFSNRAGNSFDLLTKRADGSAQAVLELDRERGIASSQWSPDGEWLVYRTSNLTGPEDILALRPGQDTEPVPLLVTEFSERQPSLSPDGRWLAYASNETGSFEIYVVPFPNTGDAKWPVSTSGGEQPVWSHSGRELFYRNGQGEMVAVPVETEPTFAPGQPEVLFPATEFRSASANTQYDVTPDDERFIMIRQTSEVGAGTQLIWVNNFFEELKARVPN